MASRTLEILIKAKDEASKKMKESSDKISKNLEAVSKKMLAVGAAGTAAFSVAISAASQFETRMSDISTLISGDSTEAVEDLSDGIKKMMKEMPVSGDDLGASAYSILSAGITDSTKALETLENASKLGVAGLGSTAEATDLLTTAINAFGLQGEDSADIADVLFKTVKNGKTDIAKLAGAFGKMAGNAKAANIQFEDAQAATAALTALTGKTSEAQNALAGVFLELTATGGKLDKALQDNGKSLEFLNTAIGDEGLVQGMKSAQEMMGLTETEFKNMFSSAESGTAVFQLLTEGFELNNAALDDMLGGANSMEEAFAKQQETFKSTSQILRNQLNVALIEIGTVAMPIVSEAMTKVGEVVSRITEAFSSLSPKMQKIVVISGLVLTAVTTLGGALLFASSFIIPAVVTAITTLSTVLIFLAANPIVLVIAALAALVAGIVFLVKNWDTLKENVIFVWDQMTNHIKENGSVILGTISAVTIGISKAIDAVSKFRAGRAAGSSLEEFQKNSPAPVIQRRNGGNFFSGQSMRVGEDGPEILTPKSSGQISPNNEIGGGITVNVTDNNISSPADENSLARKVASELTRVLQLRQLGAPS